MALVLHQSAGLERVGERKTMVDAFIDESWLSGSASDDYFLAVVSVTTSDRRRLDLTVRKIRKIPRLKARSELKASVTPPGVIKRLLQPLADDANVSIVAAIWRGKRSAAKNHERLHQKVIGRCSLQTVGRHRRIDLCVDKRYTGRKRQEELGGAIREAIAVIPENVVRVFQQESHKVKELTAPDFVARAFMQILPGQ